MPDSNNAQTDHGTSLCLKIHGIGPVPSFKNTKKIIRLPNGKPCIVTDPVKKQWMDKAIDQLECQLRGMFPIGEGETHGEWQKRLQIVWWQLLDDSLNHQLPGNQNVKRVDKGAEGCEIVITKE